MNGFILYCFMGDPTRKEKTVLMKIDVKSIEKLRASCRRLILMLLAAELVAFVLIVAGQGLPGVVLGVAAMAGYFIVKRKSKQRFGDACAKAQAEATLGLDDLVYEGRTPFDGSILHASGLVSSALRIDSTMRQRALRGSREGVKLEMSEITFGVVYPGQNRHEFASGVMITSPMGMAVETPVLLLGHNSFRHKLIRKEYEDDGWKLCPVGGKAKGWFVFTPDGSIPEQALLDKLDALNRACENKFAVSIRDGKATAFFMGSFYTDAYPLGDEVEEAALRKTLFPHMEQYIALVK